MFKKLWLVSFLALNYSNIYAMPKTIDYVMLSKQIASFNEVDIISGNLANANTPSYKEKKLMMHYLDFKTNSKDKVSYVSDYSTYRNDDTGELTATENTFDAALKGEGTYFVVRGPEGELYTRYGRFFVDNNGLLVTQDGFPVLSNTREEIILPITSDTEHILIKQNGTFEIDKVDIVKLAVVKFDDKRFLEEVGGNYYKTQNGREAIDADITDYVILQGTIEGSNVNKLLNLTQMIEAQRAASLSMGLINGYDDITRQTISKLTK